MATRKASLAALAELEQTQWYSREEILRLQWDRLRRLVDHAYKTVPYYRALFRRLGIKPDSLRDSGDFSRLVPALSKTDIQREGDALRSEAPGPYPRMSRTSGSTGTPTTIWSDAVSSSYGYAGGLRGRRWWGVDVCAPELKFWGVSAPFERTFRGKALSYGKWLKDWLLLTTVVSPFDSSEERFRKVHGLLLRKRPELVFGYGVAIYLFAKFIRDAALPLGGWRPKVVIYTSESLHRSQKEVIEEVFGTRLVCEYGCVESGVLGYECEAGRIHLSEEVACFEVEPETGELLITPLMNLTFPLLRYRIGDVVEVAPDDCPCGRQLLALRRIVGRDNDLVRRPGGQVVHAELFDYVMRQQPGVRRYRVVQKRIDALEVLLETDGTISSDQVELLKGVLLEHVGREFFIEAHVVSRIPNDPSGKFRWVISEVSA
ncbi:MAG: phenylacetate--CoA ligase family protein [Nitrospinota bacterium]